MLQKASGTAPEAFCVWGRLLGLAGLLAVAGAGCGPPRQASPPQAPNVLLISVDTLRADHLGCYGAAAVETPAIDGLARQGVRFENAFTPVPLTLPAHWTLHTGLEPWHHGVADNGLANRSTAGSGLTLAERLSAAGYDTAAFVSAFVLHSTFGLDRGFARYDDGPAADAALDQVAHATAPADERVGKALRWLQRPAAGGQPRPFFLWLHLFDPHAPYAPPAEFRARYRDRPYDGEIAFVDQQIGRLLAGLERLGLAENTLVVLVADHGESLGEHGEETHGVLLYDATLRVPLIFRLPARLPAGEVRRDVAGLADVAPTVLQLAGVAGGGNDGRDLFGAAAEAESGRRLGAISEGPRRRFGWAPLFALRGGSFKYIAGPRPELYDWQADPHELHDLAGREGERADRLARGARAIEKELDARLAERAGGAAESSEDRARLAALGYVGHSGERKRTTLSSSCGGAAPGGGPADPKEAIAAMSELDRAYQLFAENRLELAEKEFRALLECADFPAAPALEGLARIARLRGDRPAAEAAYSRLLEADPESLGGLAQLVLLARERGAAQEALVPARRLVALAPADGGARRLLAETLAAAGDGAAAEAEFRRGLAAAPRAGWLRLGFARFLAAAGRPAEARAELAQLPPAEELPEDLRQAAAELASSLTGPAGS